MMTLVYRCTEIFAYTSDISRLMFHPQTQKLDFSAGQYVEVTLRSGLMLPLSIANPPREDGGLEFHLRHDLAHPQAQQFMQEIRNHHEVHLVGPKGKSTLSRVTLPKEGILFLAGGTGFAPIKSLLSATFMEKKFPTTPLYLYWGVRKPEDAYDQNLLIEWREQYSHFNYEIILSEPQNFPSWVGAKGLVHAYLGKQHPHLNHFCVFASGPYAMIRAAKNLYAEQRLIPENFISDILE